MKLLTHQCIDNDWGKYCNHVVKQKGDGDFDWLLYDRGNPNPRRLVAANLPSPDKVKRFLMDDQGQVLMMTNKEVFRIELPTDGGQ